MTIIKRCEKDVAGSWADKQLQAAAWLDHFVPHYSGRCVSAVVQHCPAKHTPTVDVSKKWLDGEHAVDKVKIAALLHLIARMKADVALYIHGYNANAVTMQRLHWVAVRLWARRGRAVSTFAAVHHDGRGGQWGVRL